MPTDCNISVLFSKQQLGQTTLAKKTSKKGAVTNRHQKLMPITHKQNCPRVEQHKHVLAVQSGLGLQEVGQTVFLFRGVGLLGLGCSAVDSRLEAEEIREVRVGVDTTGTRGASSSSSSS